MHSLSGSNSLPPPQCAKRIFNLRCGRVPANRQRRFVGCREASSSLVARSGGLIQIARGKPAKVFPAHTPFLANSGRLVPGGSTACQDIQIGCPVFFIRRRELAAEHRGASSKASPFPRRRRRLPRFPPMREAGLPFAGPGRFHAKSVGICLPTLSCTAPLMYA